MKKGTVITYLNFIIGLRPGVVVVERVIEGQPGGSVKPGVEICEIQTKGEFYYLTDCEFKNGPSSIELLEIAEWKKQINKPIKRRN
jgi:phosphotransacetylase